MSKSFYITTTLPYVNSDPHVGFAMEIIRADVIARYKKLLGYEVFFNTGTDEHGQKIFEKALSLGKDTQEYVDEYALKFKGLKSALGLDQELHFIRTTDEHHKKAAQEFWNRCAEKGDIYKKNYKVKYCVGCELEKTESELENDRCIVHPNLNLEIREEENYFFKWSKYEKPLLDLYDKNPGLVIPGFRFNEIKAFVERGLQDFSISRLKSKMSWGVPVPGDEDHVMYVWFDALVNYISTLGWPEDEQNFDKFWTNGTPVQYAGKDNLRQQSAMWQAMLMSAGLPNTHTIVIDGFITSGGHKMSKSLGNVINPYDIVAEYGTDALRYYLLREISSFEDGDMTIEKFKEVYNANLANGLGNLVSRIMKMATDNLDITPEIPEEWKNNTIIHEYLDKFEVSKAMDHIWLNIGLIDKTIQEEQPFKIVKIDKEKGKKMIKELVNRLHAVAYALGVFLPETSSKIKALIKENKTPEAPLFARKD